METNSNTTYNKAHSGNITTNVPLQRSIQEEGVKPLQTQNAVQAESDAGHTVLYGLSASVLLIVAIAAAIMLKKSTEKPSAIKLPKLDKPLKPVKIVSTLETPKAHKPRKSSVRKTVPKTEK